MTGQRWVREVRIAYMVKGGGRCMERGCGEVEEEIINESGSEQRGKNVSDAI